VGLGGHVIVTNDARIGLRGLRDGMDPRLAEGGGLTMVVEMRSGDRGSLGRCSMLAGTVTVEALRGRNCLFGSDVDGEKMLGVPSCFVCESNDICDDRDSDMGASSGPSIFVHLFILLTLRLSFKK